MKKHDNTKYVDYLDNGYVYGANCVNEIIEGDIIKNDWCFMKGNSIIRFGEYKSFDMSNDFRQGHLGYYVEGISESKKKLYRKDILYYTDKCEVISNIHDNPELLKEVE